MYSQMSHLFYLNVHGCNYVTVDTYQWFCLYHSHPQTDQHDHKYGLQVSDQHNKTENHQRSKTMDL